MREAWQEIRLGKVGKSQLRGEPPWDLLSSLNFILGATGNH